MSREKKIVAVDSNTTLWHNRLGHKNEKDMKVLHSKKFLPSLKCVMWICVKVMFIESKRE